MAENRFWYAEKLVSRYGQVKRARGHYLYTQSGRRLVDLCQEGGRAVLGWGAGSALTAFKNTLNRGALGSFLTAENARLERAVKKLLPDYAHVRWFVGLASLKRAVSVCGSDFESAGAAAEGSDTENWLVSSGIPCLRPWRPLSAADSCGAAVFIPPFPWAGGLYLLVFNDTVYKDFIPESDVLPAPVLAALCRSVYDLIAEFPKREETQWRSYDSALLSYWKREGPYLFPSVSVGNYREFFMHCLDCGLYISPYYTVPSLVPHGAHDGDFTLFKKNPYEPS